MDIRDLRETAALARLNLDDAGLEAAFPAFEQMLGYFALMQAADSDAEAFPQAVSGDGRLSVESGFFRPDGPESGSGALADNSSVDGLIANAEERDGRFIVVPNVL
jgi:aspartyl-tRNA(Asn)/glutamyl-tRNA(Gln) amidotransferase subunit C